MGPGGPANPLRPGKPSLPIAPFNKMLAVNFFIVFRFMFHDKITCDPGSPRSPFNPDAPAGPGGPIADSNNELNQYSPILRLRYRSNTDKCISMTMNVLKILKMSYSVANRSHRVGDVMETTLLCYCSQKF